MFRMLSMPCSSHRPGRKVYVFGVVGGERRWMGGWVVQGKDWVNRSDWVGGWMGGWVGCVYTYVCVGAPDLGVVVHVSHRDPHHRVFGNGKTA